MGYWNPQIAMRKEHLESQLFTMSMLHLLPEAMVYPGRLPFKTFPQPSHGGQLRMMKSGSPVELIRNHWLSKIIQRYSVALLNRNTLDQRDWRANPTILEVSGLYINSGITVEGVHQTTIDGLMITKGYKNNEGSGIIYRFVESATLANCTITGHYAFNGGGINCYHSSLDLINCTITDNSGYTGGGAYCYLNSALSLANCIISDNTATSSGGEYIAIMNPLLNDELYSDW